MLPLFCRQKMLYLKAFSCFDLQKRIKKSVKNKKGQKKGKLVQT